MLRHLLSGILVITSLLSFGQGSNYIPGDLLIMVAPGASAEQITQDLASVNGINTGISVKDHVSVPMRAWLLHFDASTVDQNVMLRAMRNHPMVQMAQNNHIVKDREVPNDAEYADQWHHQNIDSEAAWDISTGGVTANGDTIVVCIIEDAQLPHVDLLANAWYNHAEIPDNNIDDDGNGYVDDHEGWNTPGNNDNVYGGNHGTRVAGMIGAVGDNALGVVGANWNVKMMVVDYGGSQEAAVVAAYTYPWVMRRMYNETNGTSGAFVVATNASWGIDGGDPADSPLWCAMYDSLGAVGVLNCGSTSNQNVNVDVVGDLPTACASDFMISVTATDIADNRTFSGYGLTTIDVGAPGDNVLTTTFGGGYGTTSGTSFAGPLTAGVIGLLYSAPCSSLMSLVSGDPAAGAMYVRQALFDGTEMVGNLEGQTVTGGRISAGNSMELIMNSCGTCPSPYNLTSALPEIGTANLSWSSTAGTVFDVQYRVVGTANWTLVSGLTTTQLSLTDLEACTEYEFQVSVDCGGEMSNFSASYLFLSEGCCTAPTMITNAEPEETTATISWNGTLAANTYDIRFGIEGSGVWTTLPGQTTLQTVLTGLTGCTPYEVQLKSSCTDEESAWSPSLIFSTFGCGDCLDYTYCPSAGGTTDEYIQSVVFQGINNVSGNDGGYGDHTGNSTPLNTGQSYAITLTPGYNGFEYPEWFTVYIDYDGDGIFAASEKVYTSPSAMNAAVTGTIAIPATAPLGVKRMRVIMQYNFEIDSPCEEAYDYGETEDYCVLITSNVGVSAINASDPLSIYPSPADVDLFIDLDAATTLTNAQLVISDVSGRTITTHTLHSGRNVISTSAYAEGLYTYRLISNGYVTYTGKFVVEHK